MRSLGLDIGSRTIKFVLMENNNTIFVHRCLSSFHPLTQVQETLADLDYDVMLATGYGRGLVQKALNASTVTEIKAFALGAMFFEPRCGTILDIGGQDTKAIALNGQGRVAKFEMNDRCAAGTGRFLEVMANALGYEIEEFGQAALMGKERLQISSMCTVFAETEVISLLARGEKRENIASALHWAIITRAVAMLKRIGLKEPLFFAGGVAKNPCMRFLLEKTLSISIVVPDDPQLVGAYGAAILATQGTK
jgi:predicted CoA-substrate-specific enzyme activase